MTNFIEVTSFTTGAKMLISTNAIKVIYEEDEGACYIEFITAINRKYAGFFVKESYKQVQDLILSATDIQSFET